MTITPDQADQWAEEATAGPWYVHTDPDDRGGTFIYDDLGNMCIAVDPIGSAYLEADLDLIASAPDLAQTIAGMEWQYGVQRDFDNLTIWRVHQEDAESLFTSMFKAWNCSLVRRLVGPVKEVVG